MVFSVSDESIEAACAAVTKFYGLNWAVMSEYEKGKIRISQRLAIEAAALAAETPAYSQGVNTSRRTCSENEET